MARKIKVSLLDSTVGTDGDDDIRPGVGVAWNLQNDVDGGAGDDTIVGGGLTDTILGSDGDDLIDGMGGADLLTGGAGADTFKIHSWAYSLDNTSPEVGVQSLDTITDFEASDKIDLSNVSHYGGVDHTDVHDVTWTDITLEPISGGKHPSRLGLGR